MRHDSSNLKEKASLILKGSCNNSECIKNFLSDNSIFCYFKRLWHVYDSTLSDFHFLHWPVCTARLNIFDLLYYVL